MMDSALAELDGSAPSDPVVDVVIVGAGVSGLAAARQLNDAGCTTVVLEAQPQIGGRLQRLQVGLSNRSTSGAVPGWVDLGGQWVGHTQTKTLEYAKKLSISTFPVPVGGKDTFFYGGQLSRHNHAWPSTPYNIAELKKDWPALAVSTDERDDVVATWLKIEALAKSVDPGSHATGAVMAPLKPDRRRCCTSPGRSGCRRRMKPQRQYCLMVRPGNSQGALLLSCRRAAFIRMNLHCSLSMPVQVWQLQHPRPFIALRL